MISKQDASDYTPNHKPTKIRNGFWVNPILIQGAMDSEVRVLTAALADKEEHTVMGFPFFQGTLHGMPVIIQKTFQGMVNASAATMTALLQFSPMMIVNQGICGGHDPAIHRGDLLLGKDIFHYSNLKIGPTPDPNPLTGCQVFGVEPIIKHSDEEKIKLFHSDETLLSIARNIPLPRPDMQLFTGTIASADAWIDRKDLMHNMHHTFHTSGEDMETGAVAQLCYSFGIPLLSMRILSNTLVNDEPYDETVAELVQQCVLSFIDKVSQSPLWK